MDARYDEMMVDSFERKPKHNKLMMNQWVT